MLCLQQKVSSLLFLACKHTVRSCCCTSTSVITMPKVGLAININIWGYYRMVWLHFVYHNCIFSRHPTFPYILGKVRKKVIVIHNNEVLLILCTRQLYFHGVILMHTHWYLHIISDYVVSSPTLAYFRYNTVYSKKRKAGEKGSIKIL